MTIEPGMTPSDAGLCKPMPSACVTASSYCQINIKSGVVGRRWGLRAGVLRA